MKFFFALIRTIVGLVFGVMSALALSPALASMTSNEGGGSAPIMMLAIIVIGAAFGFFASSIRRAFGRGFLFTGVCLLALPLSTALLSGRAASDTVNSVAASDQALTAVGAGLGAVALTGAAAFIGLILGGIFVITGLILVLGGRREVVVVDRTPGLLQR